MWLASLPVFLGNKCTLYSAIVTDLTLPTSTSDAQHCFSRVAHPRDLMPTIYQTKTTSGGAGAGNFPRSQHCHLNLRCFTSYSVKNPYVHLVFTGAHRVSRVIIHHDKESYGEDLEVRLGNNSLVMADNPVLRSVGTMWYNGSDTLFGGQEEEEPSTLATDLWITRKRDTACSLRLCLIQVIGEKGEEWSCARSPVHGSGLLRSTSVT